MPKITEDTLPPITDEELAFEMIEVTSDELSDLTTLFQALTAACEEISAEIVGDSLTEDADDDTEPLIH